jgi:hypothetical protein
VMAIAVNIPRKPLANMFGVNLIFFMRLFLL